MFFPWDGVEGRAEVVVMMVAPQNGDYKSHAGIGAILYQMTEEATVVTKLVILCNVCFFLPWCEK